jgi:hypothetical protein
MVMVVLSGRGLRKGKGSASFLKKRSKKLLLVLLLGNRRVCGGKGEHGRVLARQTAGVAVRLEALDDVALRAAQQLAAGQVGEGADAPLCRGDARAAAALHRADAVARAARRLVVPAARLAGRIQAPIALVRVAQRRHCRVQAAQVGHVRHARVGSRRAQRANVRQADLREQAG